MNNNEKINLFRKWFEKLSEEDRKKYKFKYSGLDLEEEEPIITNDDWALNLSFDEDKDEEEELEPVLVGDKLVEYKRMISKIFGGDLESSVEMLSGIDENLLGPIKKEDDGKDKDEE